MAEHDYVIANQNGANTRSDLNNALAAIVSNNSKASAPTTTYAYMWWADTANDILKQRNGADSAWISILTLSTGAPLATIANFTSTGIDDNATSTAITIDSAEHVSLAHGIGFNGDTAAANALDDYEEGTWTPTITLSRGWSTVTAWTVNYATYTKIGDIVHLEASITPNGGSSDDVVLGDQINIDGEPFYPTNGNNGSKPRGDCYASCTFVNGGITTGQVQFYGGYMYLQITSVGSSTTWNAHQDDPVTFSITYRKS